MSTTPCAVTIDLHRHLGRMAREDAHDGAVEAKVADWLDDEEKIAEAWDEYLNADGEGLSGIDVAIALTSHQDDRAAAAERLLALIEQKIRAKLGELAIDAVATDIQCAEYDRGEAMAEARADRMAGIY